MLRFIIRLLLGRRVGPRRSRSTAIRHYKGTTESPRARIVVQHEVVVSQVVEKIHVVPSTLTGRGYVIDGDTIQIGQVRLRLAGIDAPALDHPWGQVARRQLMALCKGQTIRAEIEPHISYDRLVATCFLPDGRDLSAEMVRLGAAIDWPRFSGGKYAHLEPYGIRKKHWKAAARQRGHMHIFNK